MFPQSWVEVCIVSYLIGSILLLILFGDAGPSHEPRKSDIPEYSALGTCPDCHLIKGRHRDCSKLTWQAWIDCTNPDFVQDRQTEME